MPNVIRQDVVQIGFDVAFDELLKLRKEIDTLKKITNGGVGDDEFEKLNDKVTDTRKTLEHTTKSAGKLGTALKKVAAVSFKALAVGIGSAATAVGKITYDATQAYSEFEQLEGGMKKIFDQANMSDIMTDANNAYKDLGISANDYLRVINDTGATFAATMGDQKGYDTAKTGLTAISDYATGTGKDINALSEKFTLITRSTSSYQSIADQFSGILPATSKDFLSQAQSAGLLSKKYTELTKVPVAEYQEAVAKMLEKGVAQLGLTGNTAAEAEKTFSGSFGMMKSAWGNLLVAIGSGEGLDQCFDNMIYAAEKFGDNLMPVLERSLSGIGTLIEKLAPKIETAFPVLVDKLLPPLLSAATSLLSALIKALPDIIKAFVNEMPDIVEQVGQAFGEAFGIKLPWLDSLGNFFAENGETIKKAIPVIAGIAGALMLFSKLKGIGSVFSGMFGGGGVGKGGLFSGIAELGNTNAGLIAKGMANIAIVIGGFTAIGAAFALVAPYIAKLSDLGSLAKVAAIITVLGVIGGVMTKFAGAAGAIPVATVALGLANIAIMLVGLTAIAAAFALVAPYIAQLSDTASLLKVVTIMTALGVVGGVMALFAAAVGLIPFPVVIAGLANMALVLGGLTALIAVFAGLSKIPGFDEFISSGGDTLANIFAQFGKIAGALANSGMQQFFNMVSGLDESVFDKAKSLFVTIGELGKLGKNSLWENVKGIFGGGNSSPLSDLANGLSEFTEKSKGFFEQIKTLEVGNLNSMIEALKNLQTATTDLATTTSTGFEQIVTAISTSSAAALLAINMLTTQIKTAIATTNLSPCGMQMMNSLVRGIYSSSGAILGAVRSVTSQINREINTTVTSANRKLSALGYAHGTSGHRGGNAIVNDGRGAELVQMPNGSAFIPGGRNVFLPNAPKGMKVLSAENTARLFGKPAPTFNYANGTDYPRYTPSSNVTNRSMSENNTYAPVFNLTISGTNSDRTMERKVKAWVRDSMNETFRSMARKSPRLQEA